MIRTTDYAALIAAKATLSDAATDLDAATREANSSDTSDLTRVAVLCEKAEDAIFDVLNAAHVYLEHPDAGAAMFSEPNYNDRG
jgi:hypothetical protein